MYKGLICIALEVEAVACFCRDLFKISTAWLYVTSLASADGSMSRNAFE